jgi:hypothetical protein|tara:strand:+ start:763 stop:1014 length:252 start_codon:yes stop_codon:yes gene_type:complete
MTDIVLLEEEAVDGATVQLISTPTPGARGRIASAELTVKKDGEVIWTGADNALNVPEWQAAMADAIGEKSKAPAKKKTAKRKG